VDTRLFGFEPQPMPSPTLGALPRPVLLCVGRVAAEKNLTDFLNLDVPGSKVVCGQGPELLRLQARHPEAHWLGALPPQDMAALYASADVLVFPSRAETFGAVMLEAMACGTPVAAYPVDGPLEILGKGQGGAMAHDLREAVLRALTLPRHHARLRALDFNWGQSAQQFLQNLVQIQKRNNLYDKAIEANFNEKSLPIRSALSPIRHTPGK
jgi:glycosyltransferase involved in cell wall biosynthesis